MKNKAVVLGANYYIGLSIIRCLGRNGINVSVMEYEQENSYGFKSKYIKEKHIVPHYKKNEKAFIDYLVDYAKKQDIKPVLFPSADQYVEVVDKNIEILKEYYLIHQTEKNYLINLMDKNSLQNIAEKNGMLIPEIINVDEFLKDNIKNLKYPCIIKPYETTKFIKVFRKKIFKVNNEKELFEYLKLVEDENIDVFIQRIIEGFDDNMYTFDFYANTNSKITHYTTAHKLRQWPINFGASVYTEQLYVKELVDRSIDFLEKIKYKGIGEIEYKFDKETNRFYLLEINVRTTNFNAMLEKVGLNMPYIAYMDIIGMPLEDKSITNSTHRTFVYHMEDYLARKAYIKSKQLKRFDVFLSLFRKKAFAIFAIDDMKPYFNFINILIKKAFKKIFKKRS